MLINQKFVMIFEINCRLEERILLEARAAELIAAL